MVQNLKITYFRILITMQTLTQWARVRISNVYIPDGFVEESG